ncbi:MAG: TetR/AcrR family transcriptional regulator [Sneathiellaceae bacterium]
MSGTRTGAAPADTAELGSAARDRILDTAEAFFAEEGYSGVSLRQITTAAGVNLAAVNYYFGSKLNLLREVFGRRAAPINAQRMQRLAACNAAIDRGEGGIGMVLAAFIEPALRGGHMAEGGSAYRRIMGRMSTSPLPEVREILSEIYHEPASLLIATLRRVGPELSERELLWRLTCVYGAMLYILADTGRMEKLATGDFQMSRVEDALAYAIPFLEAGFAAAPVSGGDGP